MRAREGGEPVADQGRQVGQDPRAVQGQGGQGDPPARSRRRARAAQAKAGTRRGPGRARGAAPAGRRQHPVARTEPRGRAQRAQPCASARASTACRSTLAPSSQASGAAYLRLVVADAVLARHEDHRGRHHPRHVDGVVAGAADDVARGSPSSPRRLRTASTRPDRRRPAAKYQTCSTRQDARRRAALAALERARSPVHGIRAPSSGWRRSTVKRTRPGTMLREFG